MNSWTEWTAPVKEWARALSGPAKLAWVCVALAIGLGLFWATQSGAELRRISLLDSRDLTVDEMGAMQVAFGKSGLNDYEINGNQIVVPHSLRPEYLKALADHSALPQDMFPNSESMPIFSNRPISGGKKP